jgi:PKD repeat protein
MLKALRDESGVSVIVGALLLILIVVIAAAGLAMIVSQAEKQQADRQALNDAVKNEKLNIAYIKPVYDSTNNLTDLYLDVQNLNIDESKIIGISLNDVYTLKFYDSAGNEYNGTNRLIIPGSGDTTIHIKTSDFLVPANLKNTGQITIQIGTLYANFFSKTIKPPTAVAKFDVQTENLGLIQRDYVILDASDSHSETGQIKIYSWDIKDVSDFYNEIPGGPINTSGSKIRFSPPSNGPFLVTLTVKDDQNDSYAMIDTTADMDIPSDPNFCPPLMLNPVYYQNNTSIVATLRDASNRPCPGKLITFQPGSNILVNQTMALTDNNGNAVVNVSFIGDAMTGTVTVSYEKLSGNIQVSKQPTLPSADFSADSTTGDVPFVVHFTDLSSGGTFGPIASWQWDFGDGLGNDTNKNPTRTFNTPGTYTVMLTVTNSGGSATKQNPNYITVHNAAPVANFNADIINGSVPLTVNFTDTSTGSGITSWDWDFGDNTTHSTMQNPPAHTYSMAGDYTVALRVMNDGGSDVETKLNYIHVT